MLSCDHHTVITVKRHATCPFKKLAGHRGQAFKEKLVTDSIIRRFRRIAVITTALCIWIWKSTPTRWQQLAFPPGGLWKRLLPRLPRRSSPNHGYLCCGKSHGCCWRRRSGKNGWFTSECCPSRAEREGWPCWPLRVCAEEEEHAESQFFPSRSLLICRLCMPYTQRGPVQECGHKAHSQEGRRNARKWVRTSCSCLLKTHVLVRVRYLPTAP